MEEDISDSSFFAKKYSITSEIREGLNTKFKDTGEPKIVTREPLSTKYAVEFLLAGTLRSKVCRYCLNISPFLSELDQIFQIAGKGALYKVTIRDMIASLYPVKVIEDPNFPNKICDKCLNHALSSYLFMQQCEQSERAIHNCFEDIFEKLEKLDPLERIKKRGRQKLHPNHNVLYAEHDEVLDYAEPIINLINTAAERLVQDQDTTDIISNELECKKCWKTLPNLQSLMNHEHNHPKTMWYGCKKCGKSFAKYNQLKKHLNTHLDQQTLPVPKFKCNTCGHTSDCYKLHLHHVENHKFKTVVKHLVEKKMNVLCTICLNKDSNMTDLDKTVCIHGGYPELTGDRTLYSILGSTLPDMNMLYNYTGTKICEKCLNHAITSYVFINRYYFIRNRLNTCVSAMLQTLNDSEPTEASMFVEISQSLIYPNELLDDNLLLDDNDFIDDEKIKIDVLEDEFRIESESEEEAEIKLDEIKNEEINVENTEYKSEAINDDFDDKTRYLDDDDVLINNLARNAKKTYMKSRLVNGYQSMNNDYDSASNICSEFLTFNKDKKPTKLIQKFKFTCPLCCKHFISDYFLKKHILKHVNKRVVCTVCTRDFKSKFYLYEHTKMVHLLNHISYMSCKTCGRTFIDENKLLKHIKYHKVKNCQLCDKTFLSQNHYDSHMQRHSVKLRILKERKAQTCSFCERECSNDNELSLHVNKVHLQIKPYGCDMCDKQYYTEYNLKSHKKLHSILKKEKCEFCDKTMKSRKQLVIHVRKHIGAKPFSCQICGQSFYSQMKTKQHMRIYHGGGFCCKVCKTVFVTKYGLKDHVNMVHSYI